MSVDHYAIGMVGMKVSSEVLLVEKEINCGHNPSSDVNFCPECGQKTDRTKKELREEITGWELENNGVEFQVVPLESKHSLEKAEEVIIGKGVQTDYLSGPDFEEIELDKIQELKNTVIKNIPEWLLGYEIKFYVINLCSY